MHRIGYITSTKNLAVSHKIGYIGTPLWSPDSNWIALGKESDERLQPITDLTFTVNIALMHILTGEKILIAEGDSEFYFLTDDWGQDGKLKYSQRSIVDPHLRTEFTYEY